MKTYTTFADFLQQERDLALTCQHWIDANSIPYHEELMWHTGGDMLVAETREEFEEIIKQNDNIGWDTSRVTDDGEYLELFLATNNAGGTIYWVPTKLLLQEEIDHNLSISLGA